MHPDGYHPIPSRAVGTDTVSHDPTNQVVLREAVAVLPTSIFHAGWKRLSLLLATLMWCAGIGAGICYSLQYESTPGIIAPAARNWPRDTSCTLSIDRPTLVMFIHPQCPCSRASLHELEVLQTRYRDRVHVQIIFWRPRHASESWTQTELWNIANRIPGVRLSIDQTGKEQHQFGARISGEVWLYLPSGGLAFHGGITGGRGHEGDNPGRTSIECLLRENVLPVAMTPAFGCEFGEQCELTIPSGGNL